MAGYLSFLTSTLEFLPLCPYFSRRAGGKIVQRSVSGTLMKRVFRMESEPVIICEDLRDAQRSWQKVNLTAIPF